MPIQSSSGNSNNLNIPSPANEAEQTQPSTDAAEGPKIDSSKPRLFYSTIEEIDYLVDRLNLTADEPIDTVKAKLNFALRYTEKVREDLISIKEGKTDVEDIRHIKCMLKAYTFVVKCFDEMDRIDPLYRQSDKSINDKSFAGYLPMIFQCLDRIQADDGVRYTNLIDMNDDERVDICGEIFLDKASKVFKSYSDQLTALRRAFKLNPNLQDYTLKDWDMTLREEFNVRSTLAIATKKTMLLSNLANLWRQTSILGTLIGREAVGELFGQIEMLSSAVRNGTNAETLLDTLTVEDLRLPLTDLSLICLDFIDFAINTLPPEQVANQSPQTSQACNYFDRTIVQCVELSEMLEHWKNDNPLPSPNRRGAARKTSARKTPIGAVSAGPGSIISVVAPSGVRVSAKIEDNGTTARIIGEDGSFLYQISNDGRWHLVEDAGIENLSETEINSETVSDDGAVANTLQRPTRAYLNAVKAVKQSCELLVPDLDTEYRNATQGKRNSDPGTIWRLYESHADKWNARSEQMCRFAGRLERCLENLPEAEQNTIHGWDNQLPTVLREQAAILKATALELTDQSKKWSLFKDYARPQAEHWQELLKNREIIVGQPKALLSDPPNTLFEIRIDAKDDTHKNNYSPVYVHIHTKFPTQIGHLPRIDKMSCGPVHMKSAKERNNGSQWVESQRRLGLEAKVHRSPVPIDFLKALLSYKNDS